VSFSAACKAALLLARSGTAEAVPFPNQFMKNASTTAPLNIVLPLTLEGTVVRLEPVRHEHAELFWEVAKADLEDIFRWIPYSMKTPEDFQRLIDKAMDEQERGESVVFATVERSSGRVIGSTRFMNIDRINRRVEIGSTWIAPAWQRTAVNTEAKYLMLRHAFEVWKCMRVELKTDALNQKSRNAILRIGAKEEGTLRRHLVTWSGRVRDTVYFSILDDEWPEVKTRLEAMSAQ
jgi:RimJ/RimL family protein N-acetyltransferase